MQSSERKTLRPLRWVRLALAGSSAGFLLAGGCAATFIDGLDQILSPDATSNLLRIPYGPLAPLIQFLAQVLPG